MGKRCGHPRNNEWTASPVPHGETTRHRDRTSFPIPRGESHRDGDWRCEERRVWFFSDVDHRHSGLVITMKLRILYETPKLEGMNDRNFVSDLGRLNDLRRSSGKHPTTQSKTIDVTRQKSHKEMHKQDMEGSKRREESLP